jgi:glycosyltransferase involved in cell wall biosynthesis
LVPLGDVAALARAIECLAADADLRPRFGQAGRQLVEQELSSERIGRDLVFLYQRLLERTPNSLRYASL